MTFYEVTQTVGPYMTWSDGTPIYDEDGNLLPSPEFSGHGVTAVPCDSWARGTIWTTGSRELMPEHLRDLPPAFFDVWRPEDQAV